MAQVQNFNIIQNPWAINNINQNSRLNLTSLNRQILATTHKQKMYSSQAVNLMY